MPLLDRLSRSQLWFCRAEMLRLLGRDNDGAAVSPTAVCEDGDAASFLAAFIHL